MISQNCMKTEKFSTEYQRYSKYLCTLGIKKESIEWRLKHIRGFIIFLDSNNIPLKNIDPISIYNYMDSISNLSPRTKENRANCIRLFLDYLYNINIISFDGKRVLPIIKSTKFSTLPSYYSFNEIKQVVQNINIKDKNGKRDYAIFLLLITYGMRLKDIQNLKYENLYWNDEKIIIIQSKDNELNEFPMIEEVRYALLDYLKNERVKSDSDYIFLNKFGEQIKSYNIYCIVNKLLKKSNINIGKRHHGPHSLRSSLATLLLEHKNGIDVISNILGHDGIDTTKLYARINFEEFKKISLEVPIWKN